MCGIVGYVGYREAWPIVLAGLKRLEYRGYDSAGITILNPSGQLEVLKSVGKVDQLSSLPRNGFPTGHLGMGHTRWATHGKPTVANAHPHTDCGRGVSIVHNGIVENYLELKRTLISRRHIFTSETDSEVIAHLIEEGMKQGMSFQEAFIGLRAQLQGSQAIVASRSGEQKETLLALRIGNAGGLVVAHRPGEGMISSDFAAVLELTDSVNCLDDGEAAVVTVDEVKFLGSNGDTIDKRAQTISPNAGWVDKEGYRHFMLKEIMEQPKVAASVLRERVNFESGRVVLEEFPLSEDEIRALRKVVLIGCGTSLHAAMVGRYLIEDLSGIPAEVDNSSEFRSRNFHVDGNTLVISVGQSGETADTLAAMAAVREGGGRLVTICNVQGSQADRLAEGTLYMRSGPEIGVASTKTFIASMGVIALISTFLGQVRGTIDGTASGKIVGELARLPHLLGTMLSEHTPYKRLARKVYQYEHFLYIGRGITYPIALEGALKLKEISYIHAEGYAAGEMKHGPIALIDPNMPVVALVPASPFYSKMVNNIKEVKARDGVVIAVITEGDEELPSQVDEVLYIPKCSEMLTPVLSVVPLQLLAYYMALRRGCDVDQPRNLAKSVTVE